MHLNFFFFKLHNIRKKKNLKSYWLDLKESNPKKYFNFWKYKWKKHKSVLVQHCSMFYFDDTLSYPMHYDILKMLTQNNILPYSSHTVNETITVIESSFGFKSNIKCTMNKDGTFQLLEVCICQYKTRYHPCAGYVVGYDNLTTTILIPEKVAPTTTSS